MWPNPQDPADLVTFTKESLMENFIFCAANYLQCLTFERLVSIKRSYILKAESCKFV